MAQQLTASGTVLVTGATGFVGSHLVERLLQEGHSVRCIVRSSRTGRGWIQGLPVEVVQASLADVDTLRRSCDGVRTIIHVAGVTKAKRPADYRLGNVAATRALIDVARGIPHLDRFTYISSLTAIGPSPDGHPLTEDAPERPITTYGRTKLEAEHIVRAEAGRLPITVVRPPAVYGPRDRDILEMFRWVGFGLEPVIGGPKKTLSLVHVGDLADAILRASFDGRAVGRIYHVSNPVPSDFHDLIACLARIVDRRTVRLRIPTPLLMALAGIVEAASFVGPKPAVLSIDKARDMVQPHWVCDSRRIETELGFRAKVPIEEGLRSTYAWYREHGWL